MTQVSEVVTADFETEVIGDRPRYYPPKPVGLALRWPGGRNQYYAWGHPTGNNCTVEQARGALWNAWQHPILFHNAAFDLEVAYQWFGFPLPREWHDTMYLLFLCYPHAHTFSLKPTSEWLLGEPPNEQNALYDWIVQNVGCRRSEAGAFISKAPADLVATYAIGDVHRTFGIFAHLWPHVNAAMRAPYDRERALMPALIDASRRGIRVDRMALTVWDRQMGNAIAVCDLAISGILRTPGLNVDANDDVADAIERAGYLAPGGWPKTATGRRSTDKNAMVACVTNPAIVQWLRYRNTAATIHRTFVQRWLRDSTEDGRLHCIWNQTRTDDAGARTGRISSANPNLANVPKSFKKIANPDPTILPALPDMRSALLPEDGSVWVSADYKSQELRILAHYEDGAMREAYNADPDLDLHEFARKLILSRTGIEIDRDATKTVGFAQLYGAGVPKLASQLKIDEETAATLRRAYFGALPGVRTVKEAASRRWESQQPIVTWGGRRVPPQPAGYDKHGAWRTYAYKGLNMLVQGSAADQTKEAIVRLVPSLRGVGGVFLSQLYDEINVSVPTDALKEGVAALQEAMLAMSGWDVPFRCDVEVGPSWGTMVPYTEP